MSTDYSAFCPACDVGIHVGQIMGGGIPSFGYGSNDEEGRKAVAGWLFEHADHEEKLPGGGVEPGIRLVRTDEVPDYVKFVRPEDGQPDDD